MFTKPLNRAVDRACRIGLGLGMSFIAFVLEKQVERMTAQEALPLPPAKD
jgi:hypothetical protein